MGCLPRLHYEKQVWPMCQSYDNACSNYLGRLMMSKQPGPDETAEIRAYLKSIVRYGVIPDSIDATATALYWDKSAR